MVGDPGGARPSASTSNFAGSGDAGDGGPIRQGPLFVLIALIGNVRGGNVDRVGELLDGMGR